MQSVSNKSNKNSQTMLHNSNQRILQTSPTAATLKSFNKNNSNRDIPPLVSIATDNVKQGTKYTEIHQRQRDRRITGFNQFIDDQHNNGWGKNIVSKFRQIRNQKNRNTNNNYTKKIQKVSHNSPSKHVYNVNMNRKGTNQQAQVYQHPPALATVSYHPTQSIHHQIQAQNEQSVAQSVFLDLQQYSSIHKYESISPYNDQFQQDKEYVKYLIKNDDSPHGRNSNNYRMHRILPRDSINLQSQDSITKSHRNSNNIPHIPQLDLHTQLSSKNIQHNIIQIKNKPMPQSNPGINKVVQQTPQKISKIPQSKIQDAVGTPIATPIRQHNSIKTKQQIYYPYIAKYLALQIPTPTPKLQPYPQPNLQPQPQQQPIHIGSQSQQKPPQITPNNIPVIQNVSEHNEPYIYSGQFQSIQQPEIENNKKNVQNTYFNRLTLQIYQNYLGSSKNAANKLISNNSLTSSILINTSSNNVSINPYNNNSTPINIDNFKVYPYVHAINNYHIKQDIQIKTPQWLQGRSPEHILRLILTKGTKLAQYLKYLSQLQIKLKHKNTHNYLQTTQKRNDIQLTPKQLLKQRQLQRQKNSNANKKPITVYYDTENDRKTSKNPSKQKSSSSNSKRSNLDAINSKLNKLLLNGNDKQSFMNTRKQSYVSNNSDNVQSLNVFNNSLSNSGYLGGKPTAKITKKLSRTLLSEIQSQDGQSNIYIKNDHNHAAYRMKTKQIEVLNILQTLLVKLSGKKCNVLIKEQGFRTQTQQDDHYQAASVHTRTKNDKFNKYNSYTSSQKGQSQVFVFNKATYNQNKNKSTISRYNNTKIHIQFEQYLENNPNYKPPTGNSPPKQNATCSTKLTTYTQRIKQLTNSLQSKQKYIQQIKSQYDYVINNYMKTIVNLKSMGTKSSQNSKSNTNSNSKRSTLRNPISSRTSKKTIRSNKALKNQSQYEQVVLSEQQQQQQQYKNSEKDTHKLDFDGFDNFRNSQPITFKMSHAHNDSNEDQWIGSVSGTVNLEDQDNNNYMYKNYDI